MSLTDEEEAIIMWILRQIGAELDEIAEKLEQLHKEPNDENQ